MVNKSIPPHYWEKARLERLKRNRAWQLALHHKVNPDTAKEIRDLENKINSTPGVRYTNAHNLK